jgi:hypothetical protein
MKKFRFPLKSVAIVREARELRLREAFSVALQAVAVAEDMLDQVRRRKTELEQVLVAERRRSFRPAEQIAFLQVASACGRGGIECRVGPRKRPSPCGRPAGPNGWSHAATCD